MLNLYPPKPFDLTTHKHHHLHRSFSRHPNQPLHFLQLTRLFSFRGIFFFTGPILLTFALIFEWVMGNFFPMMVMGLFDVFWLSFGVLQLPNLQLGAPYATEADPTGTSAPAFNAAIALYLIVWGFALLTFFFFTLKINIVFASIFGLVTVASFVLAGAYFKVSQGNFDDALKLQKVSRDGLRPHGMR